MSEQKTKVPAQFFQWFDSLKQGYENSINRLFNRVEQVNEDHKQQIKAVYQSQIDELKASYDAHLQSMRENYQSQAQQSQAQIAQLSKDCEFYQQQVKHQNQSIDKLNARYDAVIFALKDQMDHEALAHVVKDISPDENHEQPATLADKTTPEQMSEPPQATTATEQHTTKPVEDTMEQAFIARKAQAFELAYDLFYTAAMAGDPKAMGAIGRAHFVGEGVETDKSTGLAWLILAAENQFEPAIKKVDGAKLKSPDLYQSAQQIAQTLMN